jgi:aminoglycoside 2'-N-acetyltransferase I
MRIDLLAVAELTQNDRAALGALNTAVYPPDVVAAWPGRSIEWAARHRSVIVWNDDRTRALAHVGVLDRMARLNQIVVKIGGIGGVMTHPEFRHQGIARSAINRSVEFFRDQGDVDFALLVCKPELVPFYQRLGWHSFQGTLLVTQHGQTIEFTFNLPMIYPIRGEAEYDGVIDLQGPPW